MNLPLIKTFEITAPQEGSCNSASWEGIASNRVSFKEFGPFVIFCQKLHPCLFDFLCLPLGVSLISQDASLWVWPWCPACCFVLVFICSTLKVLSLVPCALFSVM